MSIEIHINEVDRLGRIISRTVHVTSKTLEEALCPTDSDSVVMITGHVLKNKKLSPQEAAERGYREFRENNKDLFKK